MADALNGIIKSLVRQGSQKEDAVILPHWIRPGASLLYESQTAGKTLPAVVHDISYNQKVVMLKFPHAKGGKSLPFAQILGRDNPLKPDKSKPAVAKASAKTADDGDESGDDPEKFLQSIDKKWSDAAAAKPVEAAPMQGPQLQPDWVRRLEKERVEDLIEDQVHDIDSSPEPEVSKKKSERRKQDKTEDLENPYALGPEVSAAVADVARHASANSGKVRSPSGSRSPSPPEAKDGKSRKSRSASPRKRSRSGKAKKHKQREASPKKTRKSPDRQASTKKRKNASRSASADAAPAKKKKSAKSPSPERSSRHRRKPSESPSADARRRRKSRSAKRKSRSPRRKSSRSPRNRRK